MLLLDFKNASIIRLFTINVEIKVSINVEGVKMVYHIWEFPKLKTGIVQKFCLLNNASQIKDDIKVVTFIGTPCILM